ncbi:MAG: hypothetical protein KDI60_04225, partial [Xanthomonadales bacterium]|nr:hypothetical protein [Xanthomonadales bacterium]
KSRLLPEYGDTTTYDMGSWRSTRFSTGLRTGHEPWQVRSGLEEGRAPARPLLISAQRKAAPQRDALKRHSHFRICRNDRHCQEIKNVRMSSWGAQRSIQEAGPQ